MADSIFDLAIDKGKVASETVPWEELRMFRGEIYQYICSNDIHAVREYIALLKEIVNSQLDQILLIRKHI